MEHISTNSNSLQQGLNEVVINKVRRMIDGKAAGVEATMNRLTEEGKISQDFIAPIGVNLKAQERTPVITFAHVRPAFAEGSNIANESVVMNMPDGQFSLHDNAIRQLADRMGIPQAYLRNLSKGKVWERDLAAHLLNEHSGWTERSRVLIRCVGQQVRGVLSDSYRRLNSADILAAFIMASGGEGAVVADAYMNDTKVWAETILPEPIVVPTAKNGDVVLFAGARFSTSDYGDGSVDLRSFLLNGICLNGMVGERVMKQIHLGAKLPDCLSLSQRTYKLDTQTTVSAVRDLTQGLFSKETLMRKAYEIQGASEIEVDLDIEIKKLTRDGGLLKSEGEEVQKILLKNDPEDGMQGGSTLWKLSQAITAHARELTPERSRELHEISGSLMNRVKLPA